MSEAFRKHLVSWYEMLTQAVLGMPRAQPFLGAKRLLLRRLGASVGQRVMIYPDVVIVPISGRLDLGDDVDLGSGVLITTPGGVSIGNRTMIGYGSKILSANHTIPRGRGRVFGSGHTSAPISIGPDVWLGANVVVLPGVSIGEGAVIAAGAVVTRSIPAFTVAAGVPAAVIREREDDTTEPDPGVQ